jgi:hypothetical protein
MDRLEAASSGQNRDMARKQIKFDQKKEVRKLARERVGTVKAARPILPKKDRAKPKYKKPPGEDEP